MKSNFMRAINLVLTIIAAVAIFSVKHETQASEVDSELTCLAKNIYFEARNQSAQGQLAVAMVTLNRMENKRWPSTVCGVVKQARKRNGRVVRNACQFSWFCDGRSDRPRNIAAYNNALELAKRVLFEQETLPQYLASATHYHTNYVKPSWSYKLQQVATVGDHIFYTASNR